MTTPETRSPITVEVQDLFWTWKKVLSFHLVFMFGPVCTAPRSVINVRFVVFLFWK